MLSSKEKLAAFKAAVGKGQWYLPRGILFGGQVPAWSNVFLRKFVSALPGSSPLPVSRTSTRSTNSETALEDYSAGDTPRDRPDSRSFKVGDSIPPEMAQHSGVVWRNIASPNLPSKQREAAQNYSSRPGKTSLQQRLRVPARGNSQLAQLRWMDALLRGEEVRSHGCGSYVIGCGRRYRRSRPILTPLCRSPTSAYNPIASRVLSAPG
jgi:Protein of unknown function (DUF2817)